MSEITVREASLDDWPMLEAFSTKHYRTGHPMRSREYFAWLIQCEDYGHSFIGIVDDRVVAHRALTVGGGFAWVFLLNVEKDYRGQGLVSELSKIARGYGPLASTNANGAARGAARRRGWTRYCDLQRYVAINPSQSDMTHLVKEVEADDDWPAPIGAHYWRQPGLAGAQLPTGDTAVRQGEVGGLRIIDLIEPEAVLEEAWSAGYRWVDFMTSWNDPLCRVLEDADWFMNDECPVPWLLDPSVPGSVARVALMAEIFLPSDLIVKRSFSDHGRVGSLS